MELEVEIVEIRQKPSIPIGEIAFDAFGRKPLFADRGVAACGRSRRLGSRMSMWTIEAVRSWSDRPGASSDHLVLDVDDMVVPPGIGATLRFSLNYSAMLDLATSPYVLMEYL
jgi:predicted amino acid racemase